MDRKEARKILRELVSDLRRLSYEELLRFRDEHEAREIIGDSGAWYQLEIIVFTDDPKDDTLRVSVAIDDGGWRAFSPLTDDFIIAPDGSFFGE